MLNIAVLVSGGGTNLQALLDSEARGENPNGKITLVVASKPGVYALERAASFGVESAVVSRKDYADSTAFDAALVLVCVGAALLAETGHLPWTEAGERYFAAALVLAVLLFLGNLAPKLPFSRHTGLRLPWTVADEDTWTVAHRLVGYLSFPLALVYLAGLSLTAQFEVLTLGVFLLWVGVPGLLSYLYFRRKWIP